MTIMSMPVTSHDARLLVQHLRDGQPHTRGDLVTATGWARGTVTQRLQQLQQTGLVSEVESMAPTGGRPSTCYALDSEKSFVAGIDLHATSESVGISNLLGDLISIQSHQIAIEEGPVPVLTAILVSLRAAITAAGRKPEDLLAVSVGLPAPVDHELGRPSYPALMPGWDGFDIVGWLEGELRVPVLVDNITNLLTLGEQAASWPVDDLVFVTVGRGIGSGAISGGRLLVGARGIAGDIGHVKVRWNQPLLCHCGSYGCLETVASAPAIERHLRAEGVLPDKSGPLDSLMLASHTAVADAVRQAGREIGGVLATVANILNPEVIVVGGSVAQIGEYLLAGIREVVYATTTPSATRGLMIAPATSHKSSGLIGASLSAINHVLGSSEIYREPQDLLGAVAEHRHLVRPNES